ncbi:MAG: carbohydrate kinase family protein [Thermodesulfobacteriota bacterium]
MEKIILGFGSLNLDLIYEVEDLQSLSSNEFQFLPGEELFDSEEAFQFLLCQLGRMGRLRSKSGGGSAANTMVALARMGFQTKFIGKVGKDEEGDFLIKNLRPVQTDFIIREGKSGICLVVLDHHQDRFLLVQGNANNTLRFEEINLSALSNISWLHLTSFIDESPLEAQKELLRDLDPSVQVSIDPGEIYAKKSLAKIRPLIERAQLLFLTEKELTLLTSKDSWSGAKFLLEMGPSVIICKRGKKGSYIFTRELFFEIPSIEVEVVDNTGAGDVYNAGFLAGYLLGMSLETCALFATHIAAKSLTGYGRDRYPNREDLESFFHL